MPLEIALVMIISTPLSGYHLVLADWRPEHDRESRQVLANLAAGRAAGIGRRKTPTRGPQVRI